MSERTRYASVLETLRLTSVRYGGVFVASRALNGALALLQVLLVTEAVGPAGAGRFFLLWTAAWLLSVVVKFGADGILPRAVAEPASPALTACRCGGWRSSAWRPPRCSRPL